MTAPVATKADESEVSGITTNLGTVEITRVIDENPASLKEFGLDTPHVEVDFKRAGDKDFQKLLIGEKTPTGASLYAKRNDDKKVFLIPAFQENTFNRSTFDLRDKTVMKFDRDKVDGVEINADGKTMAIAKEGSDWKVTKPLQTKADFGAVEGLVGRLGTAQMKSIVTTDASPADLKKYGLDKPQETVTLNVGSARAMLQLGAKAEDNTVYARDASRPMVMTVESALADDLKKGADDYRRKDVFEFRAFNATHIEFTRNGQTVAFDKVKNTGKDAQTNPDIWKRVSPSAKDVEQGHSGFDAVAAVEHARGVVCGIHRQHRPRQAGARRVRQVRGRQEGRARELRPARQRCVRGAAWRPWRRQGRRDRLQRDD